MKKIVASVGLVAIAASSLQTGLSQGVTPASNKPWNIFASLRGFYDDNISTVPNGLNKESSLGLQISPGASVTWQDELTSLTASYIYTYRYYEEKPINSTGHYDQDHNFSLQLTHAFSERYAVAVSDSFVVGQEPELLRTAYNISDPQRIPGDNIRNYGDITFSARMTPVLNLQLGYANSYYNYDDEGATILPFTGNNVIPSYSGSLDRLEHAGRLNVRWQTSPKTVGLVGYRFGLVDYTGDELISQFAIAGIPIPGTQQTSDSRNYRAHTGYLGVEHKFSPDFTGALQAGASYYDYFNSEVNEQNWSPYLMGNLRYNYRPGSFIEGGMSIDRHPTDLIAPASAAESGDVTRDQQAFTIYASVKHQFTPDLYGRLMGQFQDSMFIGGAYDSDMELYYMVGVNLEYRFNAYLSAEIGYNYDKVDSDVGTRTYSRNRVYIGVKASY